MKIDNAPAPSGKAKASTQPRRQSETAFSTNALFAYADGYARAQERAGNGTEYPTVRAAALHFKVSQEAIRSAADDYCGAGYMGVAVGARYGNRIGLYANSAHRVEAYGDEE